MSSGRKANDLIVDLGSSRQLRIKKDGAGKGMTISLLDNHRSDGKRIYLTHQEFEIFAKMVAFARSLSK